MKTIVFPMHQKRIGERIANELLMMLRGKKKTAREVSLFEPIGTDREGNEINLLDVMEQEQTDVVEEMEKQRQLGEIHRILQRQLTQRERDIIRMCYGLLDGRELTQKDVGEKLGISRSYVSRIEKRALEKLKNAYRAIDEYPGKR